MDLKKVLCVIPARGGSKGIPQKNLRLLGGIPLVEHSILHALEAGFDPQNIRVSSDSDEILDIALRNKVVANERPPQFSGPTSPTEETLIWECDGHNRYLKHHNLTLCESVLLLQPTSPVRLPSTVVGFLKFYLENDYDSALTATEFHDFFWYLEDEWRSTYSPDKRPMRQSLDFKDDRFFDNGNMYITSVDILTTQKCRLGGKVGVYPISELEGMQIDTPRDLFLFENIFDGTMSKMTGVQNESM